MSYSPCPACGADKHALKACPECGFTHRQLDSAAPRAGGPREERSVNAPESEPTPPRITMKRRRKVGTGS